MFGQTFPKISSKTCVKLSILIFKYIYYVEHNLAEIILPGTPSYHYGY